MFIAADQLLAHLVGDYILQSHWMATQKTSRSLPAALHALTYSLPFLLLTRAPEALVAVAITHFVIDRWRLARYVVWLKDQFAPKAFRHPWRECQKTGQHESLPDWLGVWLMIIADNTLHLICNGLALRYLA
jgi:hypothetical protein